MKYGKSPFITGILSALLALSVIFFGGKEVHAEMISVLTTSEEAQLAETGWQSQVIFPDWKGYTDDTLAMNSMYSFFGYHGQGTIYLRISDQVEGFRLYVNGQFIDTKEIPAGCTAAIDISSLTIDGMNTIQVSNIQPAGLSEAIEADIPFPEVLDGTLEEERISDLSVSLIEDIIQTDIDNGFTSAQLAVVRDGRLVYNNAWGRTNSYLPDGTPCTDSAPVTTDTLYDLASVTKMFSVNYGLQKLVTDGEIDLDARITQFLGDGFADDTVLTGDEEEDLETLKSWKRELTVRDLLRHQGGLPASPRYGSPQLYNPDGPYPDNPLFAGNGADEETRQATVEMICRTPPVYEPGTQTVYSDLDYMILGLVIEKITGEGLDAWMKETFYEPMGLDHITFNPLKNGFTADDCAATELNGNTRDGLLELDGFRTYTLQGEVHDETAYYSMAGVSGHAGLFANAADLAKLASVMLCGGYGQNRFFSTNTMDLFTAPKKESAGNWGLGWWRQGQEQRVWYFGTQAQSGTFGHQGWTGTLAMIDPQRNLVVIYLTNKINSPVTDKKADANQFDGNWYTASTLGFVPQILSMGMDVEAEQSEDLSGQFLDLTADMVMESLKLVPEGVALDSEHPAARNAQSKRQVFEKWAEAAAASENTQNAERAQELSSQIEAAFEP